MKPSQLAALFGMVKDGTVSNSAAKSIFAQMAKGGEDPALIADREGLRQVGDDAQLIAWIDAVLTENPGEAARFGSLGRSGSCRGCWWGW